MLRYRKHTRAALLPLLCLLFCGCTPFFAVGDLLQPPQFSDENAALRTAFEAQVGANVQYRSPVSGDDLSAFWLHDLDADGDKEALVFYTPDSMDVPVHIAVLEQTDGEWQIVQDLEGGGSEMLSAESLDMDTDGRQEVVLCFGAPDGGRVMSIFTCTGQPLSLVKLFENSYAVMQKADLNADGQTEIFMISLLPDVDGQSAQARVLQKTQNGIQPSDKCELDGKVTGYGDVFVCPTDTGCTLYTDAYQADNAMITEVIVWDSASATMRAPLLESAARTNSRTVRYMRIACRDADGDGVPEIPCQTAAFPHGEVVQNGSVVSSPVYLTQWCVWQNDRLTPVCQGLVHRDGRFMFMIPEDWTDRFSVVQYPDKRQWDFYHIDPETGERIGYLFSVLFTTREQWEKKQADLPDYTPLLTEGEDMLLVYGVNTESPLQLSEARLRELFTILR